MPPVFPRENPGECAASSPQASSSGESVSGSSILPVTWVVLLVLVLIIFMIGFYCGWRLKGHFTKSDFRSMMANMEFGRNYVRQVSIQTETSYRVWSTGTSRLAKLPEGQHGAFPGIHYWNTDGPPSVLMREHMRMMQTEPEPPM